MIKDLQDEENKPDDSRLLSFYCDYKFPEKSKAKYLFESLWGQLLHSFDDSPSQAPAPVHDILAKYSRTQSVDKIPLADVLSGLATCLSCEHVTIVIDALDECQDREQILRWICQLRSSVHLFISSRDEDDIRRSFKSCALREQKITANDIEGDIRTYLENKLNENQNPNLVRNPALREEIVETLIQNANGM